MNAQHTPGRIDRAIATCEQIERDGLNGRFASWAAFIQARNTAEAEYEYACTEMVIRATRAVIAKAEGAQ